jgi:hypothetical protein
MKLWMFVFGCALIFVTFCQAEQPYDFRNSTAYKALSPENRKAVEQVDRDFVLLWGALDMYAQDHDHKVPANLDDLVPRYSSEMPIDPFSTKESAAERDIGRSTKSKDGLGYRYRPGAGEAFIISSVGLKNFPYLAEHSNPGLYRCRGWWDGGVQAILNTF